VTISPEAYGFCRNPQTAPFAAMCANLLENDPFTPSKGKHVGAALAFLLLSGLWHVGVFSSRISAECSSSRELEKTASSDQKAA
jgi:hypothetical protein